jgi:hypothetical protein
MLVEIRAYLFMVTGNSHNLTDGLDKSVFFIAIYKVT